MAATRCAFLLPSSRPLRREHEPWPCRGDCTRQENFGGGCHKPFSHVRLRTSLGCIHCACHILRTVVGALMCLASNEADWREEWMRLREMADLGLHRIESIMDGMTLILSTKLKYEISARAKSHIEMAACTHSRIQDD